jgi:hypothetical protein
LSDSGSDSGEFLQNPDFPFDPDCTLILYGVHGRNPKGLFKKFAAVGLLIYFQPVAQYDSIIIAYETHEQACRAKNTIEGEKILFCTVREPNQKIVDCEVFYMLILTAKTT